MKIDVVAYDPNWENVFQALKSKLETILVDLNPIIEHIGSTSVPLLAAKPVIDIAIGIQNKIDLDKTIIPMIKSRHIYYEVFNASMPDRRLYVALKDSSDSVKFKSTYTKADTLPHQKICDYRISHIHIWEYGSTEWIRHIAFRDFLRKHSEIRDKYGVLKMKLAEQTWQDGMDYNNSKNDFIKEEEAKAILEYKSL